MPLAEATTSSLEALKAYSLGIRRVEEKNRAAEPYLRRASNWTRTLRWPPYSRDPVRGWRVQEPGRQRSISRKPTNCATVLANARGSRLTANYYGLVTGEVEKAYRRSSVGTGLSEKPLAHVNMAFCIFGGYEER